MWEMNGKPHTNNILFRYKVHAYTFYISQTLRYWCITTLSRAPALTAGF